MFILVALPVIVLTPVVSGIVAIARLPFAGGEVRENRRDEGVVVHHWLDEAVLRDDEGHSLALGVCGRDQATFALELEELARAGFTGAPWRLTGGDLADGPELSFPVAVDAESLAALRPIEAEALAREEAATLHVPAGASLGAVLELAPPGAVVRLAAGEWVLDAGLVLRNDVTLVGAGPDQTRLRSRNGNGLLMWNPKDPQKRLELRGLCFDGGDAPSPEGLVWLLGTAVVTDCRFTGARLAPAPSSPTDVTALSNGVNLYVVDATVTLRRCRFESKEGINVIAVQAVDRESRFDACLFDGGEHGLSIAGQGPATVAHCDFVGQAKTAFKVAERARGRLDQCVFDGAKYAISAQNQAELEVTGCRIQGLTTYGVATADGAKTTVRDCFFHSMVVAILQGPVAAVQSNNRFVGVSR